MGLSVAQMALMSRLLDEALSLDEAARRRWLETLPSECLDIVPALRSVLLPSRDPSARMDALATLPKLAAEDSDGRHPRGSRHAGERIGSYELIRPLGVGGMAEVWLARRADGTLEREVALKLPLIVPLRQGLAQRFDRERDILASLHHPNIALLFDAGVAPDGQPFLALEYVVGKPLTAHCDEHRLSIRARLQLFQQVLRAVQYAHAHLVIHRDLKPSNILVSADGQVHLLDFGIAKLLSPGDAQDAQLTRLGERALTPEYAAPEQISGATVTTAADVYALGVLLYVLLTGQRPYRLTRESPTALEEAILQAEPAMPSRSALSGTAAQARGSTLQKLVKALKGDLDTIVLKALRKSPRDRYATADAFGEDIARFLRGDTVLAQPDTLAYRAFKFARRHRLAIAVAGALIATLVGGLVATTYEAKIASQERDLALQSQRRSLTQTAAGRLKDNDVSGTLSLILEVLTPGAAKQPHLPETLGVFQEAVAADRSLLVLGGHTAELWVTAFSPDGRRIVTASSDGTARIWDATTGRELLRLIGHADRVGSVAFSPDGLEVATASADQTARLWDAATGREIRQFHGHSEPVHSVAFSPDGRRVVTASSDKTARIWDTASGREVVELVGHTAKLTRAVFSPDGRSVVTASHDGTARLWDASTGREIRRYVGHSARLENVAFSPDGGRIVTASADKTARIWDVATAGLLTVLSGHTDQVMSAAFSPDGGRIVTASLDESVRIWNAANGAVIDVFGGAQEWLEDAAFSPDGRRIVAASGHLARIWDCVPNHQVTVISGHADRVWTTSFSADGRRIVSASSDNTVRIWDSATGSQLMVLNAHAQPIWDAVFSPDGARVVTASADLTARVWNIANGIEIARLTGHTRPVYSAAFSPDGRRIVTASGDRTARIWDASTGRQLTLLSGHHDFVIAAEFSPDGRRILTASADRTARIWDAESGHEISQLAGHTNWVQGAAFSPDGRRIVTASADRTARIWDADTGQELLQLIGHTLGLTSAQFSRDGRRIVTTSTDKTARIWDAANGQELLVLSGHADSVMFAAFSPDGRRVATASADRTVRIWDSHADALDTQIEWARAAQFDPLSRSERFRLGLPAADVRQWSGPQSKCDQSAAAPYDPDRVAPGVILENMMGDRALTACAAEQSSAAAGARASYQHGRAFMANANFSAAKRDFETALAQHYRAAQEDLAMLLSQPSRGALDLPRATRLFERAWQDGVTVAGFSLGDLYDKGVHASGDKPSYLLAPDAARAWLWYQNAAAAGEPNALARIAEKAEGAALCENDLSRKRSFLLMSLRYYAAAAEGARAEDWPDDAWQDWRYRRASLARVLAREGMVQAVADAYDAALSRRAVPRLERVPQCAASI